jgi:CBS domain-containing protein
MSTPSSKVREHMVAPVVVARATDGVAFAEEELAKLGISALPVVDHAGFVVGVLSRTDLLRVGRVRLMNGQRRRVLTLPDASVRELMTSTVEVVSPETSLFEAARRMIRRHIHRLYVCEEQRPVGVIGTKEMMQAVIEQRLAAPIAELIHGSLVVARSGDPLSLAIDRMALAHHSGLVVVEGGWPVGVFTQADALSARDAAPDERVDRWMDPGVICLPLATPAFRAAEQVIATRARRLLAVDAQGVSGILTGVDFARLVSSAEPG